jgi:sortase A
MIRGVARCLEYALFVIGFVILGYCGASWINSRVQQYRGNRELDRALVYKPVYRPSVPGVRAPERHIPDGGLIGKVEIDRLHLSAVVFQGTDASVLDHGVGHLDGSPLPGQSGNVVLAAHRDTFFRGLKDIQKGDVVSVVTDSGTRNYSVESTEVVPPDQTSVLDATDTPTLTLITCYPFYYVGHAPKRFIVRARDMQAPATRPVEPVQLIAQAPKKEPARIAPSRPQDIENLTYVFRASQ